MKSYCTSDKPTKTIARPAAGSKLKYKQNRRVVFHTDKIIVGYVMLNMDRQTNRREVSVPKTELSKLLLKNWTSPFFSLSLFPPIASSLFIIIIVVVTSFRHSFIKSSSTLDHGLSSKVGHTLISENGLKCFYIVSNHSAAIAAGV